MPTLERTLAIVKPDASEHADEILETAQQAGFNVIAVCPMHDVFMGFFLFFFCLKLSLLSSTLAAVRAK